CARACDLGMILRDGGRYDECAMAVEVPSVVSARNRDSAPREVSRAVWILIAARHYCSAAPAERGQRAHACAGDAHEVDGPRVVRVDQRHFTEYGCAMEDARERRPSHISSNWRMYRAISVAAFGLARPSAPCRSDSSRAGLSN